MSQDETKLYMYSEEKKCQQLSSPKALVVSREHDKFHSQVGGTV